MPYIASKYVRRVRKLPDRSGFRLYLLRAARRAPRIAPQTNRGRLEGVRQTARPAGWARCRRFDGALFYGPSRGGCGNHPHRFGYVRWKCRRIRFLAAPR